MMNNLIKTLLLAALYIVTGKLGLLLAVPPGYATIIWPPSGIALGMLIIHGWRLWPGVLLGSFLLNASISGVYTPEQGFVAIKLLTAFSIAAGSTLQALVGRALVARWLGLPLRLNSFRDVVWLFLLVGPLACLIAASVGVGALYLSGVLPAVGIGTNWLAWWGGDIFGIVVFLPLVLIAPGSANRLLWRDNVVGRLPIAAMIVLCLPLGLTFYAWKIASENAYRQTQTKFQALAMESEKALLYRLNSYENALLGGAGFFQGSQHVSRDEWHQYVEAIQIGKNFPGINGIGWLQAVETSELSGYLREIRDEGAPGFDIRPGVGPPYYVISYIEPLQQNKEALGLNIAFEANRLQAAELSRDTGKPAITRRIILVQDKQKTPGFLLLHPLYRANMPLATVVERRAALRGWIYAPFIAKHFLEDLNASQESQLALTIYDGAKEAPDALIYDSGHPVAQEPEFAVRKVVDIMQQQWQIAWESTPAFEQAERTSGPRLILLGGLLFTGLFTLFLLVATRSEMNRIKTEFISVVSHELRTPLTSIRGSLGLILGAYSQDLPEKAKSLLDIAYNNCERLVLLVNDILDIDKVVSGQMRFEMKEESLAALTQQAVQANESYAGKFNAHIELEPIDERIRVKLDAVRYVQVLTNLLSNAAKFSPAGGRIGVAAQVVGKQVRVFVSDNGSGVPEEFRARIFEKFSQADSSATRRAGGTGLGLHISRQMIERMNGRIGFESEPGRGTTFWVEFPVLN